jgi:flavin-binding protein dodecin
MATLNKMSTKKPAVLQRAISRFKVVGNKGEVVEGQDVAYKVQPQVEGRIRLASSEC